MYHQPAQTFFVAADAAVYLFCLPIFQLVHPIWVCQKLAAHGGALDMSIEKLLLHKIRVVQAAHPANGEIGILTHFVAELEETTGMTKVRVVLQEESYFPTPNGSPRSHGSWLRLPVPAMARKQAVLLLQGHQVKTVLMTGSHLFEVECTAV